jgi:hypothetical protein
MTKFPAEGRGVPLDGGQLTSTDLFQFRRQMDVAMSRFLEIELEIGRTFAEAAIQAPWTAEALHNRRLARRAYDTTIRLMHRAKFEKAGVRKFSRDLERLKCLLSQLGDPL